MSVASFVSHALINITDPGFALQVPPLPPRTARRDKDYKKMNGVLEKPTTTYFSIHYVYSWLSLFTFTVVLSWPLAFVYRR